MLLLDFRRIKGQSFIGTPCYKNVMVVLTESFLMKTIVPTRHQ
jgi:hypothetical protein